MKYLNFKMQSLNGEFMKVKSNFFGNVRQNSDTRDAIEQLTIRELEVLQCVAFGMSSKTTGEVLGISRRTVEIHRGHMLHKLGAKTSAEAVRIAMVMGVEFLSLEAA